MLASNVPVRLGLLMIVVALAMPANGYHSTGAGIDPRGGTSYDWTNGVPNVIICESDGPADTYNDLPTPKMGDGGLCFAGLKGAAVPTSPPGPFDVTAHVMTVMGGGANWAYTLQVGGYACSTTMGGALYVNESYVYWENGGHVALFNDDILASGGSSYILTGATPTPGGDCDGPVRGGNEPAGLMCPLTDTIRICFHDFGNSVPVGIGLVGSPLNASVQVRSYTFDLPTGGKAIVPCPVVFMSGTPTDACALAGGSPGAVVVASGVIPLTPATVDPRAYLVDGLMDVMAAGFGVQDVPVTLLCTDPDCRAPFENTILTEFCQCYMVKGTRYGAG